MKKVLALFMLLSLLACNHDAKNESIQTADKQTLLERYVDSIKTVYPNFEGNIAVNKLICEDFAKHLNELPGILKGTPLRVVGIGNVMNKYSIMLASDTEHGSVSVWDENFDPELAAKIDKNKKYVVTGGTIERFEGVQGMTTTLGLGSIFIKDLMIEPAE